MKESHGSGGAGPVEVRPSARCQKLAGEKAIAQLSPQAQHRVELTDVHPLGDHPIRVAQRFLSGLPEAVNFFTDPLTFLACTFIL